ncbi:ROK family protein [Enterococcus hulanensis]|uniref:ROK family protein n=1 Tax=Enterococcus hulanensis TaxID=2559929 RepID=UPI001A8F710E|nr:ROK family protein [Enterococcus hulanensis]MBO0458236.1 ROK family protein [Enterococcus hulanensis]
MKELIIGIDLGGTSVKMSLVKASGKIIKKWSIVTNIKNEGASIIPDIIQSIRDQLRGMSLTNSDLIGIGMGSPGAIDRNQKTVSGAYNLNWVEKQEIGKAFNDAFAVPFYIENDANLAALGEKWQGSGNDLANVVFITLGTGVGGGIIINNHLITGSHGCAGEIGHLYVTDNPIYQCTCGNTGCLEAVASANGMLLLTQELSKNHIQESAIKQAVLEGKILSVKEIFDAAKEKDSFAMSAVTTFASYIGKACSHITNILDPDKIIIGGGIASAGTELLEAIFDSYDQHVFPKARDKDILTLAKLAKLGNDAGILGAAYLVLSSQKG